MKAYNLFQSGMALLILAALLTGCGTNAKTNGNDTSRTDSLASIPEPTGQTDPSGPSGQTDKTDPSGPSEQTDQTEPSDPSAQTDSPLKELAGLWVLQEIETEGDRISSELAGFSAELLLREDGTADYIELTAAGESTEYLNRIVDGDGDGRLDFSYDSELAHHECVITRADGDTLELSAEWTAPDNLTGGSTLYFQRRELDERGRKLSAAELEELTESVALDFASNGFFVCTYDRPEEIDWAEVCYAANGISMPASSEVWAAYEEDYGEIYGGLAMIHPDDLEEIVWAKTQTDYTQARKPLRASADWEYLEPYDLWCHSYIDSNQQQVIFTDGYSNGNEYYLYYTRSDWDSYLYEREFVMHCYIRDGEWQYISNLPADAPAPVTLLTIEFFDTKEEAERQRGVTEFVEIEQQPGEAADDWNWAVVTAQTDNVRYIVNRTEQVFSYEFYGSIPGDNITSGVLNAGESFALYVNQPWTPSIVLTASKDDFWGEYVFGEDNGLYLDQRVIRYVTGHDLQGEGRGCSPQDEHQLARFLMDGDWVYLDEATGEFRAAARFSGYNMLSIITVDEAYPIYVRYDYGINGPGAEASAVFMLEKDDAFYTEWSALPDWYTEDDLGAYAVSAIQLDGEQLLYLSQVNSGDGALGYLFTGSDEKDLVLHRYRGTEPFEGQ